MSRTVSSLPAEPVTQYAKPAEPAVQQRRSAPFDLLRVMACLAVILLHLAATIVRDREFLGTAAWHLSNAINAATAWCVPVFIMLSGALLLNPEKHGPFDRFGARRLHRVLPAIIVWPAVYLAWRAFYWHESLSAGVVLHDLLRGQPYIHLYFLFIIAGLYLVTPFLVTALGRFSRGDLRNVILLITVLAVADGLLATGYGPFSSSLFSMFIPYLAYYLAGWYCVQAPRLNPRPLTIAFLLAAILTTLTTALLVAHLGFESRWAFSFYGSFSPTVMVMSVTVFLLILQGEIPTRLGSLARQAAPLTFGVYLAHPIVVELLRYGYFHTMPSLLAPPFYIPVTLILTCLLTFPLIALMQRIPGLRRII